MVDSSPALHIYAREIDSSERTSLSVLTGHIRPGARVLDLGCGSGAIGRFLAQRDGADGVTIDGLTISTDEAALAAPHYRRVEVADLDHVRLLDVFPAAGYDAIVCADVLEHIRQSPRVLDECRQLLAPEGRLLLSIPNASYAGLVAELMAGEFRYRKEGLLDETHVRFFTRRTLMRFLREHGWVAEQADTIERQLPDSEFRVAFDALPPAVSRYLLALPEALTYQFIISAYPGEATVPSTDTAGDGASSTTQPAETLPAQALFSAQLYWNNGDGYAEDRKHVQPGVIGQARQSLRFVLPQDAVVRELKLDPADRAGILYLHSLSLRDAAGDRPLWQWSMQADGAAPLLKGLQAHQMAWGVVADGAALSAVLCGDDPWVKLPITPDVLTRAVGPLALEVELGWPMSADYMSLVGMIAPMLGEQQLLRAQASRVTEVMADHEKLALEHAQLHRLHAELHQELAHEQREVSRLRAELGGMAQHIDNLRNLRSVRYSQKLSHLLGRGKSLDTPPAAIADPMENLPPLCPADATASEQESALVPPPLSDTVDIIVPVYRGLADTRLCIESVLASVVNTPFRLIVINDASPEPDVTTWLRQKAGDAQRITLLENEQNLGFVATVNRGMKHSSANDVLLLNNDTEVANDWLDRLRSAAYRFAKVGSVTPFSGNATICSYPVFCAANPLPEGETTASLDRLFAQANAGQTVDVPTGVGFCMYIRRDCLNDVGLFDEERFGKGYGEENDFCQRALRKHWRNLHALDTYVRHTGGVSFGDQKSPREQAAVCILSTLYPAYEAQVRTFVAQDPASEARFAVDWLRTTDRGRRTVVLAVHHQRGGGTERHVVELARTLADSAIFLSLRPFGAHHVELQLVEKSAGDTEHTRAAGQDAFALWGLSATWRVVLNLTDEQPTLLQLLRTLGVAHIHYHHLVGHQQVIWELPKLLGVGYDFTSHDFYAQCTNITLTGRDNRYHPLDDEGECCQGVHPPSLPGVIQKIDDWRIRNRAFLRGARHVFCPSLDTASRMRRAFPSANVRFAPHTDMDSAVPGALQLRGLAGQQPLRVAVIGALSIIKGADVLEETARLAKKTGAAIEFHLIGFGYRHLQVAPLTALRIYGQYQDAELPALLQRVSPDIVWFPALWPETYSYTLSAALQAGLPVAVPNLGAFAERVAERPWSWVQAWDSTPSQWLELFNQIRTQLIAGRSDAAAPIAPPMPAPLQALARSAQPWRYAQDYLRFDRAPLTEEEQTARARDIGRFLAVAQRRNLKAAPVGGSLYQLALQVQRLPWLGPIMRALPQSWRYRVKQLLSR